MKHKSNVEKGLKLIGEIYRDVCPECRQKVIDAWLRNSSNPSKREVYEKFFERLLEVIPRGTS